MLIGLNGRLGSGKDAVYERAKLQYPEAQRHSFADLLKESVAALLGVTVDQLNEWKNDDSVRLVVERKGAPSYHIVDMNFRTFLQRYGTESHRDIFGDNFWLTAALPERRAEYANGLHFVTDVRFPNEVQFVLDLGGEIWRVHGPDNNDGTAHVSEQVLPVELISVELDNTRRDDNFKSLDATIALLLESSVSA
jgi:hypothetical protein